MSNKPRLRQRGLTMIELILFIMILGIALAGILAVMNFTSARSADPVRRKQALMLAEALLEEVELAKFSWCDVSDPRAGDDSSTTAVTSAAQCQVPEGWGAEAGNLRPFDNVNDYVAKADTKAEPFGADGKLQDANGNPLPLTGFQASVKIRPDTLGGLGSASDPLTSAEVLRITVTVDYDGQSLSLDGYRARYAPNTL